MPPKKIKLSDDKINDYSRRLAKNIFKYTYKQLLNLFNNDFKDKGQILYSADFINIALISITSAHINILHALCANHKSQTGIDLPLFKLLECYIGNILGTLQEDLQKKLIEKLH